MRNLKRVLSLALAAMMLIGMMVVGAGAVDAKDFTDYDEIQHKEAVNTMVTLNVIAGKEDGSSFDPTGTLTREEMSKIIAYVMNGGVEPVLGVKPVPTYSDIDDNWAEKYIEYCTSMGIIAGDGTGKFNPKGTLTGEQAAKMLLTAMGYNANVFGFTGNNWATNTNRYANEAGLYEDLDGMDPSAPISRDDACQLAYNAIQATMMKRTWNQDLATGEVGETYAPWTETINGNTVNHTLLGEKFEAHVREGVLTGSGYYGVNAGEKNLSMNVEKLDGLTLNAVTPFNINNNSVKDTDVTDLVGQYVKVIYSANKEKLYGIYTVDEKNTVVEETTFDKVTFENNQLKLNGNKYDLASDIAFVRDGGAIDNPFVNTSTARGDKVILISNDGDSKIDLVYIETIALGKVNYVGTDSFSITRQGGTRGQATDSLSGYDALNQKLADVSVDGELAKDAYVVVSEDYFTRTDLYTVIEPATGTVEGTKEGQWMIDGTWYKNHINGVVDGLVTSITSGDTVDYIAYGGVVYYAKKVSGVNAVDTLAFVYSASNTAGGQADLSGNYAQANLIFSDGTKKTVAVVDDEGNDVDAAVLNYVGQLVTYEVTSSGDYILETVSASNKAGFDAYVGDGVTGSTGTKIETVSGKELTDDAVVFVYSWDNTSAATADADNNAKVISGKDAKSLLVSTWGTTADVLTSKVNGFEYAKVAVVVATGAAEALPGSFDGKDYGYLVADAYRTYDSENTTYYRNYRIWDGTQEIVVKEKTNGSLDGLKAGAVITFDQVDDTTVKNVAIVTATLDRVTGYDEGAKKMSVVTTGAPTKITEDTIIMYVNSDTKVGATGGSIQIADDTAAPLGSITAADQANVRWVASSTDATEYAFILVDVENKMKAAPAVLLGASADAAAIEAALDANGSATLADDLGSSETVNVDAGQTLNVAYTQSQSQTINVQGGTLNVGDGLGFANGSSITATSGSAVNFGDIQKVGGNGLTSTDTISLTLGANNKLTYTLTADAVLNGSTLELSGDALAGNFKITGTDGAKIVIYKHALTTGAWEYDELTITNGVATVTADKTFGTTDTNKVFTWTTSVDSNGDAVEGWVVTNRT